LSSTESRGKTTFLDLLNKFPANEIQEYLKRYFYQIIGIYFPAIILVFYILLFWQVGPNNDPIVYYSNLTNPANNVNFTNGWPTIIPNNMHEISTYGEHIDILQMVILLIIVVILGEGINAVTSRFTLLSPVITNWIERIKFSIKEWSFPAMSKISTWPVWLNETSFPVSFAEFDRYYISALEQDKRTLAGKIGWISFYRNMFAVFIVILILQTLLIVTSSIKYCNCYSIAIPKIHGYEMYVIIISIIAAILFRFGLRSQEKSSKEALWDAYKRYQLRKNLEIRHGDITIAFRIKEDYKKIALDYIIDRWFLGVENAKQTISRYLLTKLETEYKELRKDPNLEDRKKFKKINGLLTDSYRYWNNGAYEHVISTAINAFKELEKLARLTEYNKIISLSEENWKSILGFYILENSLRTDAAFAEINKTILNSKWIEEQEAESKDTNKSIIGNSTSQTHEVKISNEKEKLDNYYNADYKKDKKYFDKQANLIRETTDLYQKAFFQIMFAIEKYNEIEIPEDKKEEGFKRLEKIYESFGEFDYDGAFKKAKALLEWLNEISKMKICEFFPKKGLEGGFISIYGTNFGDKKDIVWFDNIPIKDSKTSDNKNQGYLIWHNGGNRIDIQLPLYIKPKNYEVRVSKEKFSTDPVKYEIEAYSETKLPDN
jgi:hypothetical protein